MVKYWWQVGDKQFKNKPSALLYSHQIKKHCEFETDHQVFVEALSDKSINDDHDYDLDFILHLRNSYKKIRLFYTGGFDSHTILCKFLENNVRLDEVTIVWASVHKNDFDAKVNKEYKLAAQEFLKKNQNNIGNVTHVYNALDVHQKLFSDKQWLFKIDGGYPHVRLQTSNFSWCDDFNSQADCNIVGKEKPHLIKIQDKWYATTTDTLQLEWFGLKNKCDFWSDPLNIKSFIRDGRLLRKYLKKNFQLKQNQYFSFNFQKQDYVDASLAIGRTMVPHDITGIDKMGKATTWANEKDAEFIRELIDMREFETLINLFRSYKYYEELLPEMFDDSGNLCRHLTSQFLYYIDIDTLEYYQAKELDISCVFKKT